MQIRVIFSVVLLFGVLPIGAQSTPYKAADSAWTKLEFVLGRWTGTAGEKDTPLGAGQGGFSFEPELNQKIIIRHSRADYNSGARHEDLMVIFLDPPDETPRALYFDTEGHVIRYNLSFPSPDSVIFESDATESGPRFRLSYWMKGTELDGKFEVAPPGAQYKTYMSWTSKKD